MPESWFPAFAKASQGKPRREETPLTELTHLVDSLDEGQPVRRVALTRLRMSYGQFKRAKFQGEVLLDGNRVRADHRVHAGQTLLIRIPDDAALPVAPYALPLILPYRDENFCVVDKPAPLPSTSSPRKDALTLENAFYSQLGCPQDYVYRPVNRLDKGTSGLMIVALSAHAQQRLQGMLHTEGFVREYRAVCEGRPPTDRGVIDLPIAKADAATLRREVRPDGKPAVTHYELVSAANSRSLVRLRLETGRTHQIRVHLAALGCPVAGDFLYGQEHPALPGRFALHSHRIRLLHPFTDREVVVESPLPDSLATLMRG
jgi:23S rRNA pseudouridine1911/1915/1917 synthase